jgi:hypothetical protein
LLLLQGRGLQKTSNKRTFCYFAITPEIKSDHKQTCYNLVSTIRLWYKTVDFCNVLVLKLCNNRSS